MLLLFGWLVVVFLVVVVWHLKKRGGGSVCFVCMLLFGVNY